MDIGLYEEKKEGAAISDHIVNESRQSVKTRPRKPPFQRWQSTPQRGPLGRLIVLFKIQFLLKKLTIDLSREVDAVREKIEIST